MQLSMEAGGSQIWEIRARARAIEPRELRCRSPAHGTTQHGAGSRRRHGDVRRRHRLTAWYTGDELEKIRRAAAVAGITPAAWLEKFGTDNAEAAASGRAGAAAGRPT
jgi:hypothetical protein